jgi:hypothetical protein
MVAKLTILFENIITRYPISLSEFFSFYDHYFWKNEIASQIMEGSIVTTNVSI